MTESEQIPAAATDQVAVDRIGNEGNANTSPGALLSDKRKQLGWSITDVASHLKLAPRQIEAIETDNYAALPTMVMTRGFIRSYAKLLGLESASLLAMISPPAAPQADTLATQNRLSTPFPESRFSLATRSKFAYKWLVAGALLLALIGVAVKMNVLPALQNAFAPSAEKVVVQASATADKVSQLELPSASATAESSAGNPVDSLEPSTAASSIAAPEPVEASAIAPPQPTSPAPAVDNQLSLKFRQDSWVEIKRADNSVLISRLVKAGSSESFDMTQPVTLTIGNLAGVDVSLRGEPVDLKVGSKTNVARLNLK
ncbi:helix-turn-helix domain-containing protein [Paraherbaspirillum soli]|uniref:Helix-turn-helix domain-containing protein n=1 Tax=Paraherbaspirillum soli TaxID=631222 RepID=A0ABW0MC49_9BURK